MLVKTGVILSLGFLFSAYVAWKNLKSDYDEEKILTLVSLLGIVGVLSGYAVRLHEWGVMFPALMVLGLWCRKYKWNMGEWLDVLVPQGLLITALMGLWPLILVYVCIMVLKRHYRKFSWYKSGKPGLIGLAGLAGWGFARIIIAFWDNTGVYLAFLTLDQWVSVVLFTSCVIIIYLQSGQKITWRKSNIRKKS